MPFLHLAAAILLLPQEAPPRPAELRWKIHPSVVELNKRILVYTRDQDLERARKAAAFLAPYRNSLERDPASRYRDLLDSALASGDPERISEGVLRLEHADCRFLLDSIGSPEEDPRAPSPRSRLLYAKASLNLLIISFPRNPAGTGAIRLLNQLVLQLARVLPARYSYGDANEDWKRRARELSGEIKKILALRLGLPDGSRPVSRGEPDPGGEKE